jgi:hypothetical protein
MSKVEKKPANGDKFTLKPVAEALKALDTAKEVGFTQEAANSLFEKNLEKAFKEPIGTIAQETSDNPKSFTAPHITPAGTDVAEEVPTDRQIRNAEKVLKAAGLDPEAKISEAVANALQSVQATGTFMFEGVLQEPIATGLKVDYNRIRNSLLPKAFYLPHQVSQLYADKVFSLYLLKNNGIESYYLLDGNSTVTLGGGETRHNSHAPTNLAIHGTLVLINSSSNEDLPIGESLLVNTESSFNVLNNSVLARTKEVDHRYGYGFNHLSEEPAVPTKDIRERMNVKEGQFKRTSVFNSAVSHGVYRDSQIHDTQVSGSGYVTVTGSQLFDANVRGTRITVKDVHLNKSGVIAEGELLVKHTRFNGVHISAPSVYVPNKFSYLELDTPQHKLYFVRSTRRDFDLGTQQHSMERMRLDTPDEDIQKFIAMQLSMDPEGFHTQPTLLTRSIASYLTDSITSRLKVVRLLDEARQLVREVGDRTRPWDDIYAV